MPNKMPPNLLLPFLVFCIAFLLIGQGFASAMMEMDSMPGSCLGCDYDSDKQENTCDSSTCLQNSCVNSFTVYQPPGTASVESYLKPNLILRFGNRNSTQFKSQFPIPLFRPPIA
jgi:hypothetical protein